MTSSINIYIYEIITQSHHACNKTIIFKKKKNTNQRVKKKISYLAPFLTECVIWRERDGIEERDSWLVNDGTKIDVYVYIHTHNTSKQYFAA